MYQQPWGPDDRANRLGEPLGRTIFPEGSDDRGRPYADLRWNRFKHFALAEM